MTSESEDMDVCQVPTDMFQRARGMDGFVLGCLWSNPTVNAVGVTVLAEKAVAEYTGLPVAETTEILGRLAISGQIVWDNDTEEAWVPDWLQFNYLADRTPASIPGRVISALEEIRSAKIRILLVKEIARLDVQFDASATQARQG